MQSCNKTVRISNCIFQNNSTAFDKDGCNGGAIFCDTSKAAIVNSTIIGNIARDAGAVYISHSSVTFENCIIAKNKADMYGGALYIAATSSSDVISFKHCTIVSNEANKNTDSTGGAMYFSVPGTIVTATNSIFWQNTPKAFSEAITVTYSFLQEVCVSIGNITDKPDPLFTNVINNNFTLQSTSPCKAAASDGKDMGVVFSR